MKTPRATRREAKPRTTKFTEEPGQVRENLYKDARKWQAAMEPVKTKKSTRDTATKLERDAAELSFKL